MSLEGRVGPVRAADPADIDRLAEIWHAGWHEVHATILPRELTQARTLESFGPRLRAALADIAVAGPVGAPLGFCILKGDELNQLYVTESARGSGVAAALMENAETRFIAAGMGQAWLACGIGNDRAARFYEKHAWARGANVTIQLEIPGAIIPLVVWRFQKELQRRGTEDSQRPQRTDQ